MINKEIVINKETRNIINGEHGDLFRLGVDGENLQENIIFKFDDEFVNGTARVEITMQDGTSSYIMTTKQDESYVLPIKSIITKKGLNKMQLVITQGTSQEEIPIFKSKEFDFFIDESINAESEAPEEYPEWLDVANAKLNEIDEAIDDASNLDIDVVKENNVATITITKQDETQKIVEIYDGAKGDKGEQGIQGPKGDKGNPGENGKDGIDGQDGQDGFSPTANVSKSGSVATISITDKNGTTTTTISDGQDGQNGQDGSDGQDATINGVNTLTIEAGNNIDISQSGSTMTISSTSAVSSVNGQTGDVVINIPDVSDFITKDVNDLTYYESKSTTANNLVASINSSTYVMTLALRNSNNETLNTQTIDLPLEAMVVSGSYDSTNKKIILTLQSGQTIDFSVADLVSGLQIEITSNNKLSADLVDDTNTTNKFVSASDKTTWNAKYDKPSDGIPSTDLSSAVQTSLGKADTALQSETYTGTITSVKMNGSTIATSGEADLGTVITSHQDISGKQDIMQYTTMPTASIDYLGKIVQYVGTTDSTYDSGYFYRCNLVNGVYTWQRKNVQSQKSLTLLSYGNSTWQDFLDAYNSNSIVYCRASSGSNPGTGNQTRLAFMAYVNNPSSPTSVEFQYYRSVSTHSESQQGDQIFVYKLTNGGVWSVETRETTTKIVAGTNLSSSYSNGTLTINNTSGYESGSNSNGNYIKFDDGTLITYQRVEWTGAVDTEWGSLYRSASIGIPNFPYSFISVPTINYSVDGTGNGFLGNNGATSTTTKAGSVFICRGTILSSGTFNVNVIAVGKWK